MQGNVAGSHSLDKARNRLFVVIGREGGGKPKAERPCRRQCGTARKCRITVQDFLWCGSMDDEILKRLARDRELDPLDLFRRDLEGDLLRLVDEDPVSTIGQIKGNIFI